MRFGDRSQSLFSLHTDLKGCFEKGEGPWRIRPKSERRYRRLYQRLSSPLRLLKRYKAKPSLTRTSSWRRPPTKIRTPRRLRRCWGSSLFVYPLPCWCHDSADRYRRIYHVAEAPLQSILKPEFSCSGSCLIYQNKSVNQACQPRQLLGIWRGLGVKYSSFQGNKFLKNIRLLTACERSACFILYMIKAIIPHSRSRSY